ncbi:RHS repeat-associated core domain-containing protein [Streptomyces sp. HM190]|uniref:RHS repeat-associated core domain-containing protein n=1 Tax=Streptomyces sp. HM190 TaxID=2695266 RepID=UPI001F1E8711|nr:RHS repeat-associated core domain-containing protein [Streptomyces sp. HM190]
MPDLGGALGATYNSSNGDVTLQLTNLHGDVTMTLPTNDPNTAVSVTATDEYGNPIAGTSSTRYRWLGGKERSAETPTGDILMGARLYNPANGRFLSTDPLPGGSANSYDYTAQDPVNKFDLDGRMIVCGDNRTGSQCSNATTPWYYEGRYSHITGWQPSFYSSMPGHIRAIFQTLEASFMGGVYIEEAYWRYDYHYSRYYRYYHGQVQHKTTNWRLYAEQPRLKVWINFFGDYTIAGYWDNGEWGPTD